MGNHTVSKGFFWKLLERLGVSGTQFVLQIVLARLLSPAHYGALSIMLVFTTLATVFIQTGFNTSLIQNKDVTEDDYSSVLWVSLVVATVLYVLIFLGSPLIANFYDMSEITSPMRVLALMLFPGALNSVQLAKVSREMDFKKVFLSNLLAIFISGVVGVVLAIMGAGLWALVAQTMLNVIVACIVMRFTVKLKIQFKCNFARIKVLFSYGWKLLVSALLDTLYQELQGLVIGKKYNSGTLGYFNRGKQFPQFLMNAINGAVQSVMLPALSAQQDHKEQVKTMMRSSITLSAYVVFPMMAGLAAIATPLVTLLLTEKWLPCVAFMQIYCVAFAFYPIHTCNLQAINAMGRSDIFLKLEIIKKSYGLVCLIAAVLLFDSPIAIAMTSLITTWIGWFVNARPNKKLLEYSFIEQIKDLLPSMLMAITMFIVVMFIGMFPLPTLILLLLQVLVGIAFYLLLSVIIKPKPYIYLCSYVKKFLNKYR